MICERCKIREANIKYTEVLNGVKTEHNLCAQCMKEMDMGPYSAIFDTDFPLGKLFSGLLGLEDSPKKENLKQVVCPSCKMTYDEIVKNSQFGCGDCYSVFDPLIGENIKQLQGNERHVGKKPKSQSIGKGNIESSQEEIMSPQKRLELYQQQLKEAIRMEEYEAAAQLRDQIKGLKEEMDQNA